MQLRQRQCCTRHDWGNVTNPDFIESLLLEEGADPNVKDHLGLLTADAYPQVPLLVYSPRMHISSRTGATFPDPW
jgi:hypothetical protein